MNAQQLSTAFQNWVRANRGRSVSRIRDAKSRLLCTARQCHSDLTEANRLCDAVAIWSDFFRIPHAYRRKGRDVVEAISLVEKCGRDLSNKLYESKGGMSYEGR